MKNIFKTRGPEEPQEDLWARVLQLSAEEIEKQQQAYDRAVSGDPEAQYFIAKCFRDGEFPQVQDETLEELDPLEHAQSDVECLKFFSLAAEQGHALAQFAKYDAGLVRAKLTSLRKRGVALELKMISFGNMALVIEVIVKGGVNE